MGAVGSRCPRCGRDAHATYAEDDAAHGALRNCRAWTIPEKLHHGRTWTWVSGSSPSPPRSARRSRETALLKLGLRSRALLDTGKPLYASLDDQQKGEFSASLRVR